MAVLSLRELFPGLLFRDPELLRVYAYFIREVTPQRNSIPTGSFRPVSLEAYESAASRSALERDLTLTAEAVKEKLQILAEFNLVSTREVEDLVIVKFKRIFLPPEEHLQQQGRGLDAVPMMKFSTFAEKYLEYMANNTAPKTVENSKRVVEQFKRAMGDPLLTDLRATDLEAYKEKRRREWSATTVNIDTRTLKAAMNLAVDWEYLPKNPFAGVRPIRQEKKLTAYISREDFQTLIDLIEEPHLKRVVVFAALTGMRRGEILYLQWKDVDYVGKQINVQSSEFYKVKHGKARPLPITPGVEAVLKSIEEPFDPFVFTNPEGERLSGDYVTKKFKAYIRAAGFKEELKFHSLRATFASWAAAAGVEPLVIKELLGHAYLKTTENYTRVPPKAMVQAMEKLGSGLSFRHVFGK